MVLGEENVKSKKWKVKSENDVKVGRRKVGSER